MAAIALAAGLTAAPAPDAAAGTVLAMSGNGGELVPGYIRSLLGGNPVYPQTSPLPQLIALGEYQRGYVDPSNPDSPYRGYDYQLIDWPAATPLTFGWDGKTTFEQSQQIGVANLEAAISRTQHDRPGEPIVAVGYSSSANVMVRELRALAAGGSPHTGDLSFVVIGNVNRPNGGIAARLPGVTVPILGVGLDGATPADTGYPVLDVSWQYDPISDFPVNPLNLLALANSGVAFLLLHANYFPADLTTTPRAFPDTTVGNITYITLKPPRLPLLVPAAVLGVPPALLDLVEPALTVLVDAAYDYDAGPATPVPLQLQTRPERLQQLPGKLTEAIHQGVRAFVVDLRTTGPAVAHSRRPQHGPSTTQKPKTATRSTARSARHRTASPDAA